MLVKLPNLGEGADSGSVAAVLVKPGEAIEKDQTIIEIESEKALVPVPSPSAGTVAELLVAEGDAIAVGQAILQLEGGDGADDSADSAPSAAAEADSPPGDERLPAGAPVTMAAPAPARAGRDEPRVAQFDENTPVPPASPTVRKIARQIGLDLRFVPSRSRGGRVELDDIRAFIRQATRIPEPAEEGGRPKPEPVDFSKWGPVRAEPMSELRKIISRRMTESKHTAPHVTQFESFDITELNALRKQAAPAWKEKGAGLTLTVFAIRAVVQALGRNPLFNASLDEAAGKIVYKDYYHIGVAVDTEAGLMVPVLRDADKKSLFEIARELGELAANARDRKLGKADMAGGTFTVSNQGGIGGAHFTPVINQPESAILGLGRGSLQPGVVDDGIEPRLLMPVAVSYDHRLIDGARAAKFVVDLAEAFAGFTAEDLKL